MRLCLAALALALILPITALAQSTAQPTVPGQLTQVGCVPPATTPCFVPSTPSTPLEVVSTTFSAGSSTTLPATTTTSNVALPSNGSIVEVANGGSVAVNVVLGVGSGTTATLTTGYSLPAGWTVFFYTGNTTYLAGITASSTATLTITSGNLIPISSGGGGPTSNVNINQVNGSTPALTVPLGGFAVLPSASASAGITPVFSAAAESSHVLKNAAGNLYSVYATNQTSTSGFLVVVNATSAPADGAIAPPACVPLPANGVANINYESGPPEAYSTGITAIVTSGANCQTKTTGVITAFFNGHIQ